MSTKATKKAVAKKARKIAEEAKDALVSEHSAPTNPAAISDRPIEYEVVPAPYATTSMPQVYDPDGTWVGFFGDEEAANAWVRKQKRKGFVVNYEPPPRKIRKL